MTASPLSLSAPVSLPASALGKARSSVAVDSARLPNPQQQQQNEFEQAFHALLSPKQEQAGSPAKKIGSDNGHATGNSGSTGQPPAATTTKNKQPAKNSPQDASAAANGDSVDLSQDAADAAQAVPGAVVFAPDEQHAQSAVSNGTIPEPLPSSPAGAPAIAGTLQPADSPALALRVKPSSQTSDNADQPDSGSDISSLSLNASLDGKPGAGSKDTHEGGDAGQRRESGAPAQAIPSASPHNANRTEPEVAVAEGTSPAHSSDFEAELAKYQPVRGAHVQIAGSGDQRVDIRLIEHSGTLSVTVRSSDHVLARSLQEQAPELHARLASEHYRSELWSPSASKTSEMRDGGQNGQREANHQGQRGSSREGQNRQNDKQNQQPGWLENFEQQAKSIQSRIEYSWHQ